MMWPSERSREPVCSTYGCVLYHLDLALAIDITTFVFYVLLIIPPFPPLFSPCHEDSS